MSELPTENNVHPTEDAQYPVEDNHPKYDVESSHSPSSSPEQTVSDGDADGPETVIANRHVDVNEEVLIGGVTSRQVFEARQHLERRRAEQQQHTQQIMHEHDFHESSLPSLQGLREERVRLTEQIRHHKDEQDSLTLDIEGQHGAADVYQVAARVQRYEHFAARSKAYAEERLPEEVSAVVEEDQRHSEEEIAAFIQELQARRETILRKVSSAQERSGKRGGKKEVKPPVEDDESTKMAIAHAEANVSEAVALSEKVKRFRTLKTKLSSEIVREKQDSKKIDQHLKARIKNAELVNARDARQCGEINSGNACLTTNAQLLLSQLNAEHYGMDNVPTDAQMIEERREFDATPEPTPVGSESRHYARGNSVASVGSRRQQADNLSVSSRQSRPPLVASKPTASQQSRIEATKHEREDQRRSSEVASHTSSRRQSLSKPPLVASKPTASQTIRDEAVKQEREEQQLSVSRSRPRAVSNASERPPSVASKSTASQRNREAVPVN